MIVSEKDRNPDFEGFQIPLDFGMELDNPYNEKPKEKKKVVRKIKKSQITSVASTSQKSSLKSKTPEKSITTKSDASETVSKSS